MIKALAYIHIQTCPEEGFQHPEAKTEEPVVHLDLQYLLLAIYHSINVSNRIHRSFYSSFLRRLGPVQREFLYFPELVPA